MKVSDKSEVLLIDETISSLKLVESVSDQSNNKAVLATLFGTLSDFGHATRNGRRYTGSLWKKVLADELFQEAMRTHTAYGEADHPKDIENRLETHIPYVSHIIRDVSINEAKQVVEGYLDILDTPNGRIVKTLLDYGCQLGVSSRGSGDLMEMNGETYVDENCYNFITWDIVARPSNKAARVNIVGNTKKSYLESINEQIEEMITSGNKSSLMVAKTLVESANIPTKDKVINRIKESLEIDDPDNKINQTQDIIQDEDSVPKADLDEAYRRVLELKSENDELKSETEVLKKSLEESENTISDLNDLNKNLSSMVTSYMEELQSVDNSNTIQSEEDTDKDTHKNEEVNLTPEVKIDPEEVIDPISEMLSVMLAESNSKLSKRFNEVLNKMDQYIDTSDRQKEIDNLKENLSQANSKASKLQKTIKDFKNENLELTRKISSTVNEYFKLRCSQLGLNEQVAKKEFNNRLYEYDLKDIDEVLNELYQSGNSKYSKLMESTDGSPDRLGSLQLTGSIKSKSTLSQDNYDDDEMFNLTEQIRQVKIS